MANLKFADTHNIVAFLSKPAESDGFEQIMDFLNAQPIRYALTVHPTIYISCIEQFWSTGVVKTINGEVQLHALVDGKKIIISEASVRRDLKLEDEEGMIRNLDNVSGKFLMYPRFVQVFLDQQLEERPTHKRIYNAPSHTKKIFGNMRRVGKGFSGRVTPLFPTMVVQNQSVLGEGSANPTDPHHTPTIIQPSTQLQKTQKPRKPKRKDTQVPQPSIPSKNVAYEVVHKELGDSLVEATTTTSSLKAKQDSVLDLEKTKTTQANEIASLKRRVKKLEKKRSSRTHKLKRLYKVGLSARVESSGDEEDLGEDASKQRRRINAIDADEDITLVKIQDDADNEMFNVNALGGAEVFVVGQNENVVKEVVNDVQVNNSKIDADHQLAERLQAQEQEELSDAEKATLFQQLLEKRRKHFAAKRAEEQRNKPPT
ncbi:hypothetical protein Tco_0783233 [Tanacetum coccineum]